MPPMGVELNGSGRVPLKEREMTKGSAVTANARHGMRVAGGSPSRQCTLSVSEAGSGGRENQTVTVPSSPASSVSVLPPVLPAPRAWSWS